MDSTNKSSASAGLETAIVPVDGAKTPKALLDMNQHPADDGDEDGVHMDVVQAGVSAGAGGSSPPQRRKYYRLSQEQVHHLEALFQQNQLPDTKTKKELAGRIGVTLNKVHLWFRGRRTKLRQIQRDQDQKQQAIKLIDELKTAQKKKKSLAKKNTSLTETNTSLAETNTSLTETNTSLTKQVVVMTEQVSSLSHKIISVLEQNNSLTEEKYRLETELAEIKAAPMPPVMLPIDGLPQVFVALCPVCSPIFRVTAAAAGAPSGSQMGSASAAKLCPDCLKKKENMEAMVRGSS